jgi:hypothetical protein
MMELETTEYILIYLYIKQDTTHGIYKKALVPELHSSISMREESICKLESCCVLTTDRSISRDVSFGS